MTIQSEILTDIESGAVTTIDNSITHVAVGSGNTTPIESQTTLDSEDYRESIFNSSTTADTYTASMFIDTTENNGNTIKEIGTFNASSSGTMASRNLTNEVAKTSYKELFYDIKVMVEASNS